MKSDDINCTGRVVDNIPNNRIVSKQVQETVLRSFSRLRGVEFERSVNLQTLQFDGWSLNFSGMN